MKTHICLFFAISLIPGIIYSQTLIPLPKVPGPKTNIYAFGTPEEVYIKNDFLFKDENINVWIKPGDDTTLPDTPDFINLKNTRLPSFEFTALSGAKISSDALTDTPVFLYFFSTSCLACSEELNMINKLQKEYGDRVIFLALTKDNASDLLAFLGERKFNFEIIPGATDFYTSFGIRDTPKGLFINKEGIIDEVTDGIMYEANELNGSVELQSVNEVVYDRYLNYISYVRPLRQN